MPRTLVPFFCRLPGEEGNPGDIFIAIGLQEILEDSIGYGHPLPWLNLSKFQPAHIQKHLALVKEAGYLIIGGTPQYNNYDDWCLWYDRELWNDVLVPNKIKVFPLAGGSGYPSNTMDPREFADYCLSSDQTRRVLQTRCDLSPFFTVRDEHAASLLRRFDRSLDFNLMGCTATFASKARNIKWEYENFIAIVPPCSGAVPDQYMPDEFLALGHKGDELISAKAAEVTNRFIKCGRALAEEYGYSPIFVAHGFPEYMALKKANIPPDKIFFSNDYHALLRMYSKCNMVLSGRLHGALPAFGMCGPRVVHVGIDTRMSAIDYFGKWIGNIRFQDMNEESVLKAMENALPWTPSDFDHEYWSIQVQFYRDRFDKENIF